MALMYDTSWTVSWLLAKNNPPAMTTGPDDNAYVGLPVRVHLPHEPQHHDRHDRPHVQRHIGPGLAPGHVIQRIDRGVHHTQHDQGRRPDHGRETAIGHLHWVFP